MRHIHMMDARAINHTFSLTSDRDMHLYLILAESGGAMLAEPLESATLAIGRGDPSYALGYPEPAGLKMGLHGQAMAFLDAIDSGATPFPLSTLADHAASIRLCEDLLALPEPS